MSDAEFAGTLPTPLSAAPAGRASDPDRARRAAARRFGRNLAAMAEADEREFAQGEAGVARVVGMAVAAALAAIAGGLAANGWPLWAKVAAACGVGAAAAAARVAWRSQQPDPPPPPEDPAHVRIPARPAAMRGSHPAGDPRPPAPPPPTPPR